MSVSPSASPAEDKRVQTFKKKRIELVVEAPVVNRALDLLDDLGVSGYTVLPATAGRGRRGKWTQDGLFGNAGKMVQIVTIVDESMVPLVLEELNFLIVERHIGIVCLSDVEVIRQARF